MIKEFYYIENKTSISPGMTAGMLNRGPLPILWHNQGIFGLIPAALVANALTLYRVTNIAFSFTWDQTIGVTAGIGMELVNEQFDNQASNGTNSDHD